MTKLSSFLWHFRKNRTNTIIMVLGLSIAFSLTIYISGYVFSELSYDQFIKDKDRIYRLYMSGEINERPINMAVTSPKLAVSIKDVIPELESITRINDSWSQFKLGNHEWNQHIVRADTNFFTFFDFKLITQKDPHPLSDISNLIISENLAKQFFGGSEDAIGQNIKVKGRNGYVDYFVGGVFEDITNNFHLPVEVVQSVYVDKKFDSKSSEYIYTYIKTKKSLKDKETLDIKLTKSKYIHQYGLNEVKEFTSFQEFIEADDNHIFILTEALKDIHFSSHKFENATISNKTYVYGAIILALLVVIISFINYFNLSLATITNRFKTYGIQRTIGADKRDIARAFFKEGVTFTSIVFVISYITFKIIELPFSEFTGLTISDSARVNVFIIPIVGIVLLGLILGSGIISFLIVTQLPSQKLMGKVDHLSLKRFTNFRNFFMILQFTLASFVIVTTLLVNKQIHYFAFSDKGFDTENIITFELNYNDGEKFEAFKQELEKNPLIYRVGASNNLMGDNPSMGSFYYDGENYFHGSHMNIDAGFSEVYNLELIEGRFFSKSEGASQKEVIINESAAREFPLDGQIIGNYLVRGKGEKHKIVGIVRDFNYRTLHHPIEPLVIMEGSVLQRFSVKVNNSKLDESIQLIKSTLNNFGIGKTFSYQFVDDYLATSYYKETRFKKLLTFITILAIFISSLGLFAISQITVLSKRKEIAIRKINGARIDKILTMLNGSFIKYILIALMIAYSIGWYAMHKWLENFAYKTKISWWIFALAGLIALGVALITVSWQSWKAATRNPVEALRYE